MQEKKGYRALMLLIIVLGCMVIGGMITLGFGLIIGVDMSSMAGGAELSLASERNGMRLLMLVQHLFVFLAPTLLFLLLFEKHNWREYLYIHLKPRPLSIALGIVLLMIAYPFVQKSFEWNNLLPLPEILLQMESGANEAIKNLLEMDNFVEFLLSLIVISIMPGITEELLFRGVIQNEAYRWFKSPHLAIWVTAFIFSAIHFQFLGFLPRLLLGAILGYAYYFSKNLWVPILIHAFNNGLPIVSLYILGLDISEISPDQQVIANWQAGMSLAGALVIGYIFYRTHKPNQHL